MGVTKPTPKRWPKSSTIITASPLQPSGGTAPRPSLTASGTLAGGRPEATAQVNLRYGTEPGVTFYTHLSDQYGPYRVKVISSTVRDAPHMIDGLLYHETDLQIHEHYSDTWGYTDQVFGMAHLLGFRFAPRIRDLGDKRLYSFEKPATYPGLESFLGGTINVKQMDAQWDDLLRLTSSRRKGTVTASLILRKLASYHRP